jgi:hypothetical protein
MDVIDENLIKEIEITEKIEMAYNNITKIPDRIRDFVNLKILDLSGNKIDNIKILSSNTKLEVLKMSNNLISNFDGLVSLKNLTELDLSFNHIMINRFFLSTLRNLQMLNNLALEGNLNYNFNEIKFFCLENILNLEILDNQIIYKKAKKKLIKPVYNEVVTQNRSKKIRLLKDYIKYKQEEISKGIDVKSNPIQKDPSREVLSYYYFSKIKFEKN